MRAVVLHEFGGPDVLRLEDVPTPQPGPGEALIQVHGVSINHGFDLNTRAGRGRSAGPLPLVLGADPVGVVVELGSDVEGPRIGDRVAVEGTLRCGRCEMCLAGQPLECRVTDILGVHRWGGNAEYVSVPVSALKIIPPGLGFHEATVIFRHGPTAFCQLTDRAGFKSGEWVLVMGAAGALGNCLVQVARALGGTVIATAGTDERVAWAQSFGADHGVNYRSQDLAGEVMRMTDGRGVEVICDNVADPSLFPAAFAGLAVGGRLVTTGTAGGGLVPLDVRQLYRSRQQIIGGARPRPEDFDRALETASRGQLRAAIDRVLPLSEAAEGHRLAERGTLGKIILDPTLP